MLCLAAGSSRRPRTATQHSLSLFPLPAAASVPHASTRRPPLPQSLPLQPALDGFQPARQRHTLASSTLPPPPPRFTELLKPVATSSNGDRITLPVSALETLTARGAIDAGPMAFELCAMSGDTVVSSTHAGVAEFIASEGTVGIPPKTALSLTRDSGPAALSGMSIRVK